MDRTHAAVVACGLLLAVAGCSGSGGEPAPTVTPADVPEVTTGTPAPTVTVTPDSVGPREETPGRRTARPNATIGDVSFPPGTDRRGVVDGTALVGAHAETASDGGYVLVINRTVRTLTSAGTLATVEAERTVFRVPGTGGIGARVRQFVDDGRETNATATAYLNGSTAFTRRTDGGNVTYERNSGVDLDSIRATIAVSQFRGGFADEGWRPLDTTTVDGEPAVVFTFDPPSGVTEREGGRLVVTERGTVRVFRQRRVSTFDGERRIRSISYRFEPRPNVTVARPDWLEEAIAATQGDGSGSEPR